jgi:hypothetical protein
MFRNAVITCALIVPLSTGVAQQFLSAANFSGLERLDYRGTINELVGNEIELIDPLSYWQGNPQASLQIYADSAGRDLIETKICKVEGNSPSQLVSAKFALPQEGRFYVLRIVRGRGLDQREHRYGAYWIVQARWPVLSPKIERVYHYGQYAYFNFAAGHSNYDAYSYELLNSSTPLFAGQGSVVSIDSVWRMSPRNRDRPITLRALHNGKPFLFKNLNTGKVDSSVWEFTVRKPTDPEVLTAWTESNYFSDAKSRGLTDSLSLLDANTRSAFLSPTEFRFAYTTRTRVGVIVTSPQPRGSPTIDISVPEAFKEPTWGHDDWWLVLQLTPNHDYLRRYSSRRPLEVKITISFEDQFNTQTTKSFTTQLFSSR